MKILLISDHKKKIGGAEIFTYNLQAALIKRGHEVEFFGSRTGEDFASFFSRWYSPKWYQRTIDKIKNFKPDIVHLQNCYMVMSLSPAVAANKMSVPVVMTLHDFHYYCPKTWGIYKDNKPCRYGFSYRCFITQCRAFREGYRYFPYQLLKCSKVGLHRQILKRLKIFFVSPSENLARNVEESLKVKVKVINNGINLPKKTTNYQKNILFVGRIGKEKGLKIIADVLSEVKDYKTLVLGTGALENELKEKYKNIHFLGFQKPSNYYQQASILVVPSLWQENFPTVVLEAMSYGLCVVASNIGGIPEIIEDNKTGLLFEPGNKEDFKNKLNYLLDNPDEIKRMGREAQKLVKRKFAWQDIVKKYEQLYESLISLKNETLC